MEHHRVFLADIVPPQELLPRVLARIKRAARRRARMALAGLTLLAAGPVGLLILAVSYANQELYASGFYEYVSLLLTDSAARAHWQELFASLGATLPSAALLAVLASGALLWWSASRVPRMIKITHALFA